MAHRYLRSLRGLFWVTGLPVFRPRGVGGNLVHAPVDYGVGCAQKCMYTYIHTRTHTHTCIHTHVYIYMYVCTYIHTYIHAYMHPHIHTYMHAYIHTYTHTHIHTDTYIQTYIHTYMCVCVVCVCFLFFFCGLASSPGVPQVGPPERKARRPTVDPDAPQTALLIGFLREAGSRG